MIRALSIGLLLVLSATSVWWVFCIALALYAFFYGGIELIFIAFLADAFYGTGNIIPLYTLLSALLLIISTVVKPYTILARS